MLLFFSFQWFWPSYFSSSWLWGSSFLSFKTRYCMITSLVTLSLPRVINFKFPQQPHKKYYFTQYEEIGLSYYLIHAFLFKSWKDVLFELGSEKAEHESCTSPKCIYERLRIGSILVFHLSKLRKPRSSYCVVAAREI